MRPKQWVKNGFVFAPLLFSGLFLNIDAVLNVLHAAFLFCVASSATYIINDISDLEHDCHHPKKAKTRPLAAGIISLRAAIALLVALYATLLLSWLFLPNVLLVITAYLILNLVYTFVLKHQPVIDIFVIAMGFVLRVYAGAMALGVPVSSWMFITTLCLALYLAAVKRRQELTLQGNKGRKVLEKYSVSLIDRYAEISASGALFFYSMFVMSERPELAVTVPLVIFGLFRYWYIVETLDGGESPSDALFADAQLLCAVVLWAGVCVWVLRPAAG